VSKLHQSPVTNPEIPVSLAQGYIKHKPQTASQEFQRELITFVAGYLKDWRKCRKSVYVAQESKGKEPIFAF